MIKIYARGSGRTEKGVLGKRLKGEPSEGFEGAVAMGVAPTVVDEHGDKESDEGYDQKDRDDPRVASLATPVAGFEEGEDDPLFLEIFWW